MHSAFLCFPGITFHYQHPIIIIIIIITTTTTTTTTNETVTT